MTINLSKSFTDPVAHKCTEDDPLARIETYTQPQRHGASAHKTEDLTGIAAPDTSLLSCYFHFLLRPHGVWKWNLDYSLSLVIFTKITVKED